MIEFTRACARSAEVLLIGAVLETSDTHQPETRLFRFEHDASPGEQRYYDDFDFHLQAAALFQNDEVDLTANYPTYLSSQGDVFHAWWKGNLRERIEGAGTDAPAARGYGRLFELRQIGARLYACGDGGQIYVRAGRDAWRLLTSSILFDPESHQRLSVKAPPTDDPAFLDWLDDFEKAAPRNILLNACAGTAEDAIFFAGEAASAPTLFFWNGRELEELSTGIGKGAYTGIHIENENSVWICGREGLLVHGSRERGFSQVSFPRNQTNSFHDLTRYQGKLVLPASVGPGGLFEVNLQTSELRPFRPALPTLRGDYIFFAEASETSCGWWGSGISSD
jgi:hypothetical protein